MHVTGLMDTTTKKKSLSGAKHLFVKITFYTF